MAKTTSVAHKLNMCPVHDSPYSHAPFFQREIWLGAPCEELIRSKNVISDILATVKMSHFLPAGEWTSHNFRRKLQDIVSHLNQIDHISRQEDKRIVYVDQQERYELCVDHDGYIILRRRRRHRWVRRRRKPARYVVINQNEDFRGEKFVKYEQNSNGVSSFRTAAGKTVYESASTTLDIAMSMAVNYYQSEQKRWLVRHDNWNEYAEERNNLFSSAFFAAYLSWKLMPVTRQIGTDMVGRSIEVNENLICTLATFVLLDEFRELDVYLTNSRTINYWKVVESLVDYSRWLDEGDFEWMSLDDFGAEIVRKCMLVCTEGLTLHSLNDSMRPGVEYLLKRFLAMTNLWTKLYEVDVTYLNRLLSSV